MRCASAVVLGLVAALASQAAAPPARPANLTAEQQRQIQQWQARLADHAYDGRFDEALQLAQRELDLRRRVQGERHWQTVDAAGTVRQWQRLAALPASKRPAAARALLRLNQGEEAWGRRQYGLAEKAFRQALPDCRSVAADSPETARCLSNLALCHSTRGEHGQAQPLLEKVLALTRRAWGENHPDTAAAYRRLARCLHAQGKLTKALPLYDRALSAHRKALGEEHPALATSCHYLAECLEVLGKHAQAQPLREKALAVWRAAWGEQHALTATWYNNLGLNLSSQGKHSQAQPLLEKALAIRLAVLGEQHPETAAAYDSLAYCLGVQGKQAQAQPLAEKALVIRRTVLGEQHPLTAGSYTQLAFCLNDQGKQAQAQPLFATALAIRRKARGEHHLDTAQAYNNLAFCLAEQRRHAEARPLFEKALAICLERLGEQHPSTAISYNNLGSCLSNLGEPARAQVLYQKALAIFRKTVGDDHPNMATGHNNVADCLHAQGKRVLAQQHYDRALAIRRRSLGDDHPLTAHAVHNAAVNLWQQGRHAEAVRLLQASLPGQEAARFHLAASGFDRAHYVRHAPAHGLLALGLARLGQPHGAFRHAEASLARGLLDDLASTQAESSEARDLREQLRRLDARLVAVAGQAGPADEERARAARQRQAVLARLARLAAEGSARQVRSLEAIQKHLAVDDALVLWLDVPPLNEHWGCVVRRDGPPAWARLRGTGAGGDWTARDNRLPIELYSALMNPDSSADERQALLAALRRQRFEPVVPLLKARGKLPAARRLLVVPTGPLAFVPVELFAGEQVVGYVPSGSVLAHLGERRRRLDGSSLLAVGDPIFTAGPPPEPPARGVLVEVVLPGGNAAKAGLQAGDVLLAINKVPLESADDLKTALTAARATLLYWREGRQRTARLGGGSLGAVVDPRSLRAALRAWRKREEMLVQRGTGHRRLPGTRLEVEAIGRLAGRSRALLGSDASEQNLAELAASGKLRGYRLLHLATHGEIDARRPERSALILAQDRLPSPLAQVRQGKKVYDGRLTIETIRRDWRLDADLVVLSACQTALGQEAMGEGLLGFAQAFLSRGARSVVLSRWKVEDTATALLMVRFYENLLGKRTGLTKALGRAEALAEAKQWLRQLKRAEAEPLAARLAGGVLRGTEGDVKPVVKGKRARLPEGERPFAHPYYWAAFVLVGDPE